MTSMRIFNVENSLLNRQRIFLSRDVYNRCKNAKLCKVRVSKMHRVIGRLCLCEDESLENCAFIDKTVILPDYGWESYDPAFGTADFQIPITNMELIDNVKEAQRIEILVVCQRPSELKRVHQIAKDFMRQLVVNENCFVFPSTAPELKIFALILLKVEGNECDAWKVTDRTDITIKAVMSLKKFRMKLRCPRDVLFDEIFFQVTAFSTVSKILAETIYLSGCKTYNNKILLIGPSGSGKTSLIFAAARKFQIIPIVVNMGELKPYSSEEALRNAVKLARGHAAVGEQSFIALKNIDRLNVSQKESSKGKIILRNIAGLIEATDLAMVATTSSPEDVHRVLRRVQCFHQEVEIPVLSETDRKKVFLSLLKNLGLKCSDEAAERVARWTPGYILSDLQSVVRECSSRSFELLSEDVLKKSVAVTTASSMKGTRGLLKSTNTTFAEIGGLYEAKKLLELNVLWPLTHPQAFERLGLEFTKGILLFGPPGCAKTSLVKALANESGATFLAVSAADLYSPYVGESEKRLTKLFTQARIGAPSIIFIDEIDALVGSKGASRESGVQERILATLLVEMDGVGLNMGDTLINVGEEPCGTHKNSARKFNNRVIVIGATNKPDLLDDALKRPGRFDKLINVPLPDYSERLAILEKISEKMPLLNVNLPLIAKATVGLSGAELKSICTESGLLALTDRGMDVDAITQTDFEQVLRRLKCIF